MNIQFLGCRHLNDLLACNRAAFNFILYSSTSVDRPTAYADFQQSHSNSSAQNVKLNVYQITVTLYPTNFLLNSRLSQFTLLLDSRVSIVVIGTYIAKRIPLPFYQRQTQTKAFTNLQSGSRGAQGYTLQTQTDIQH